MTYLSFYASKRQASVRTKKASPIGTPFFLAQEASLPLAFVQITPAEFPAEGGEEGLAGYALWLYRRNSAQVRLYSIAVDEQSQGRGVGASLLAAGEAQSTERGCSRMSLEVKTHNHSAVHLYRKLGFEEVGVWPCYYEDGTDALRLVKELPMSTALSAGR